MQFVSFRTAGRGGGKPKAAFSTASCCRKSSSHRRQAAAACPPGTPFSARRQWTAGIPGGTCGSTRGMDPCRRAAWMGSTTRAARQSCAPAAPSMLRLPARRSANDLAVSGGLGSPQFLEGVHRRAQPAGANSGLLRFLALWLQPGVTSDTQRRKALFAERHAATQWLWLNT